MEATVSEPEPSESPRRWPRILALVLVVGGLVLAARWSGATEDLSVERVRDAMEDAGAWGFALFLLVFAAGELAHVPGLVFVAAAILAYGRVTGAAAAYSGAVLSVCVSFAVVRGVGGKLLSTIERPAIRTILDRLEEKPIRVVALLRLILWMAPPLNYALAMSNVRFRDYLVGSLIGLVIPIILAATFLDWLVEMML